MWYSVYTSWCKERTSYKIIQYSNKDLDLTVKSEKVELFIGTERPELFVGTESQGPCEEESKSMLSGMGQERSCDVCAVFLSIYPPFNGVGHNMGLEEQSFRVFWHERGG